MLADRCQLVGCTLEAVERMGLSCGDDLEGQIVVVAAYLALSHKHLLLSCLNAIHKVIYILLDGTSFTVRAVTSLEGLEWYGHCDHHGCSESKRHFTAADEQRTQRRCKCRCEDS